MSRLRYAATIFLGAFLLFQVQPMLAKAILPWFGGTPAVWTTCMLFFQLLLLGGYAYAHLLAARLQTMTQVRLHAGLLAVSLFFLRILPAERWRPSGLEAPAWRIIMLLAVTIGIPYLVLASTSPLLQSWFRLEHPDRSPYRLYALSNLGSLLALVSYPFLVEPNLPLGRQALTWTLLYVLFAAGLAVCGWMVFRLKRKGEVAAQSSAALPNSSEGGTAPVASDPVAGLAAELKIGEAFPARSPREIPRVPTAVDRLLWAVLAACGSILLLATTNQLSQDVSVVPFMWVVPLALYLFSFILCFESDLWYWRPAWLGLFPVATIGVFWAMNRGVGMPLLLQILVYPLALFIGCMVCHGELARQRPSPEHLTSFYLSVAAGGAAGGFFVGIIAPAVFRGMWEFPFIWPVIGLLALVTLFRDPRSPLRRGRLWWAWVPLVAIFLVMCGASVLRLRTEREDVVTMSRNFYGVLKIEQSGREDAATAILTLMNGRIQHGFQYMVGPLRRVPVSYYGEGSGISLAVQTLRDRLTPKPRTLEIGVVGLGAGLMAGWGQRGDVIRFYEINPNVVRLSDKFFSYRKDTQAGVELVMGDARLSLEREAAEGKDPLFDLLVLDAFSGDAIPLHLLTREVFAVYWKRLKPGGVLAVHISNRYLNLGPLVRGLAAECGKQALLVENDDNAITGLDSSTWVLVTSDYLFINDPTVKSRTEKWPEGRTPIVFTDRYSNLFRLLK